MKLNYFLFPIVLIGLITGILTASSSTETIIWCVVGAAGLLGAATWGMSSKQVVQFIKDAI